MAKPSRTESLSVLQLAHDPETVSELERLSSSDSYTLEQDIAINSLLHGDPNNLSPVQKLIAFGYVETLAIKLGFNLVENSQQRQDIT